MRAMQEELRARRDAWVGAALFALACGVRFVYVASVADEPAVRYPVLDAQAYHEWALSILAGDWQGDRVYYQDPLYPFFLAGLYALFGPGSLGVLLAQAVLDAVSVVLLAATARRLFDPPTALAAGLLASFYAVTVYYVALLLKAPLLVFLFTLALYVWVRAARSDALGAWLAAGVALGTTALVRANALLFAPVLALWLATDRARTPARRAAAVALAGLGTLLVLVPVAVRNYAVGGDLVLINSQGGQNFYIGNFRGNRTGAYRAPPFLRADPRYEEKDFRRVAEAATGRPLSPSQVSRYWLGRGLAEIAADPAHFAWHVGKKLLVLVNHHEIADNYSFAFVAEVAAPVLRLPLPSWGLLLPLALCGAAFAGRRRDAWLLLAFALAYAASLIVFFNLSRLRLPLVPVVIAFGAHGAVEIARRLRARQLRAAAPALAFLLVAYPVVFADVASDPTSIRYYNLAQRHMGVAFQHQRRAVDLSKRGDERAAREALRLAEAEIARAEAVYRDAMQGTPDDRLLRSGLRDLLIVRVTKLHRMRRDAQALAVAEQLVSEYPDDATAHAWLAAVRLRLGLEEEAQRALATALDLDPDDERAKRVLRALRRTRRD